MKCASTVTLVVVLVAVSQLLLIVFVLNALSTSAAKDQIPPCDFEYSAAWFITPTPQPPVVTRAPRIPKTRRPAPPQSQAEEDSWTDAPAAAFDDGLPLKVPPFAAREFGTVPNTSFSTISSTVLTEAYCDCYEGSCTLFLKNAVVKRVSPGRFVVRATPDSNRERLEEVLRNCRNDYSFCEPSHSSVYCSGVQFELSSRTNNQVVFEDKHIMLTARRLGWEFYYGLVYPRGVFLNWALLKHAAGRICANSSACMAQLKTVVFLTTDYRRSQWQSPAIVHIQSVLQFPEPTYFALRTQQAARWISFNNRILSYDGRIRDTIVEGIEYVARNISESASIAPAVLKQPQAAAPANDGNESTVQPQLQVNSSAEIQNNTAASIDNTSLTNASTTAGNESSEATNALVVAPDTPNPKTDQPQPPGDEGSANEPQALAQSILVMFGKRASRRTRRDDAVKTSLATKLPVITGKRSVSVSDAEWDKWSPSSQLSFFSGHSMFLVDEVHTTWMLFTHPGTTWVLTIEYRHGYDSPTIGLHIRTWLLRRNCRLVVFLYWEDPLRSETQLFAELAKPYKNEISVVSPDSVKHCDSVVTCGNVLDYSLILDTRGLFEN